MVTIMQLTDNLKSYISSQLESMSKSSPVIGFMKPLNCKYFYMLLISVLFTILQICKTLLTFALF